MLFLPPRNSPYYRSVSSGFSALLKFESIFPASAGKRPPAPLCWFTHNLYLALNLYLGWRRGTSPFQISMWDFEVRSKASGFCSFQEREPCLWYPALSESALTAAIPEAELSLISWTVACCMLLVPESLLWNQLTPFGPSANSEPWFWLSHSAVAGIQLGKQKTLRFSWAHRKP